MPKAKVPVDIEGVIKSNKTIGVISEFELERMAGCAVRHPTAGVQIVSFGLPTDQPVPNAYVR